MDRLCSALQLTDSVHLVRQQPTVGTGRNCPQQGGGEDVQLRTSSTAESGSNVCKGRGFLCGSGMGGFRSPAAAKATNGNNNRDNHHHRQLSVNDLTNTFDVAFRDGVLNSTAASSGNGSGGNNSNLARSSSWYDGFFGCLKPVMTLMGKAKPADHLSQFGSREGEFRNNKVTHVPT